MTEELKPVPCGCGGEAEVLKFNSGSWIVMCSRCRTSSENYTSRDIAITAWNKALGERTAKVIDKSAQRHSITDFDWIGKCEKCGNEIQFSFDYCPSCGARLEWE